MPFRELPGATLCRFKRGERLIYAGEKIEYLYYLQKGTVYREFVTAAGKDSVFSLRTGGSEVRALIGLLALFRTSNAGYANCDFVAHTGCVCYRIPAEICLAHLRRHPDLLEEALRLAMEEYDYLLELFQARQEGGVAGRLCGLLLERACEDEAGSLVPRACSNVEIARFLSVHKVTVSRILRALKEEGAVERTPRGLLLKDPERLRGYAAGKLQLKYK